MKEIRLLLADKNLSYVEVAKKMLKFHDDNFIVDVSTTAEECFEKLGNHSYDLVLLDYEIDENNGLELLNRIIRSGFEVPVIMMVEEDREEIAFKALEHGAADYIMKVRGYLTALPFTVGKVLERQKYHKQKKQNVFTDAESAPSPDEPERNADEAYYLLDRRGQFISANKMLEKVSEYTEDELMELTISDIIPQEQENLYNQWLSSLETGYNNNSFMTQLVSKYGKRRNMEISLSPVYNRDREITSYKGKFVFATNATHQEALPRKYSFDQSRMIAELVDIVNSSYNESLNHILQRITTTVCQLFRFKRSTLALLDRRRNVFVKQAMVGYIGSNGSSGNLMEVPQDIIEKAFSKKYKIKVMYFDQNLRVSPASLAGGLYDRRTSPRPENKSWHPNDMIVLNLVDKNEQSFGYISIDNPDFDHSPTREVFYNLELFGSLAALAIENHYRFATIEKRNRRLKQLLITSNIFKLHLSLTEMLNEVVWSIKFSLDFNLVMLGLVSKRSGGMEIKAIACDDRIKTIQLKELKFYINSFKQLFKKNYRHGKSYYVNNEEPVLKEMKEIYYDINKKDRGEKFWPWYGLLLIPIRSKDHHIIGFLMIDDPADNLLPTNETIHTLEILATQVSVAIENRLIYLQLKEKASHNTTHLPDDELDSDRGIRKIVDKLFR